MRTLVAASFASLLAVSFAAACGGTTQGSTPAPQTDGGATVAEGGAVDAAAPVDASIDVDNGSPSDTYPAAHPPLPTVVSGGGPTLKTPRVVPIFFPNYPYKAQIIDYLAKIGATPYWTSAVAEYDVGPLTAGTAIELTETPAATIDDQMDLQPWLMDKLSGMDPQFGMPDTSTIYAIFYPTSTTITLQGESSCVAFGGYHANIDMTDGSSIAYAVVPQCPTFHALAGLDVITGAGSHELIEAVTDPYPYTNSAYSGLDDDHAMWEFALGGAEVGDMCSPFDASFYKPDGFDYIVQRTWSNAAAMAGHDPCVPGIPTEPYFNSAPNLPDTVTLNFGGQGTLVTKGVKIPAGMTKTIEIDLFSEAKTSGPWTVSVKQPTQTAPGQMPPAPTLDLKLDRTSGVNGEKLHLTITVLKAGTYKAELFEIVSTLGAQKSVWVGLVGN